MDKREKKLKYIVVGTGRCGTKLFQEMFNSAGVNCGHEDIFNTNDEREVENMYSANYLHEAESSWAAAAYLRRSWIDRDIKIVHLVRNPLSVIRSFWDINFFCEERVNKPLNKLVYENTLICRGGQDRLVSSIDHYFQWNSLIEESLKEVSNPSILVRLEDIKNDISNLNGFLDLNLQYTSKKVNLKINEKSDFFDISEEKILDIINSKYSDSNKYGYF